MRVELVIWECFRRAVKRIGKANYEESDTPREAGGLMSWAASKAVVAESRRRAKARLG